MSAIRDGRYPVMLDKERHLLYDLNALDMFQERFGSIGALGNAFSGPDAMKNMRYVLTVLLREGDPDEELSEREVGRLVHVGNLNEVRNAIFDAITLGNNGTTKKDDDDVGNVQAGKGDK